MTFTIDRKTWLRGEGLDASRLLRPSDGKMCCLGSFALACGLSPEDIRDKAEPSQVTISRVAPAVDLKAFGALINGDSTGKEIAGNLMAENDETEVDEDYRESKIISGFKQLGHTALFIN